MRWKENRPGRFHAPERNVPHEGTQDGSSWDKVLAEERDEESKYVWVHKGVEVSWTGTVIKNLKVAVEALADPHIFRRMYPDLISLLGEDDGLRQTVVAQIDIYDSHLTGIDAGKTGVFLYGAKFLTMVRETFVSLAEALQDPSEPVQHVKYLFGTSRLGSVARHFGFDTFQFQKGNELLTPSYGWAQENYQDAGLSDEEAKRLVEKRPPTFAVISREKFVELYGDKAKG